MIVDWASACATLPGQSKSGDRPIVVELRGGALVGAIDGLGHGPDAHFAAELAAKTIEEEPESAIEMIVERCHQQLRATRGCVLTLARFAGDGTMTWVGVGNVDGVLVRAPANGARDEGIALRGGIVGHRLPPLNVRALAISAGDTLVLATDGVRHGFRAAVVPAHSPQTIADDVLAGYGKGSDDACVVVARYAGAPRGLP